MPSALPTASPGAGDESPPRQAVDAVATVIGPVTGRTLVQPRPRSRVWRLVGARGEVAVKVSPAASDRGLRREGAVLAELDRARLLPRPLLVARGEGDGVVWTATRWQRTPDLATAWAGLSRSASRSPGGIGAVVADAAACARTLATLHRAGVRHGDLRPEHLLCEPGADGAMILDWASGVVSRPVSGLTAAAVPAADYTGGCPLYAPPEVADAIVHGRVPEPSEAADVWSFAESMRVALGGARPWGGGGEPAWSRIARGDLRRPFPPGTARRWPEFAALMARALDPDPRARPSADEIACVLRDAVSYRARTGASAWTVAGASRPVRGIRSWSPLVCPRRLRWV